MITVRPGGYEYVTKGELAYRVIRQRILSGELAPGGVINQVDVAADIGMSTTPLREALNRLQADGLVYTDAYRDTRVVALSSEEAQHIYELRLALDPLGARLAAERRSDDDIVALRVAAERLGPAIHGTSDESIEAHFDFHRILYAASKNPIMTSLLDVVWARSDRYRRFGDAVIPKRTAAQRHAEHIELMELVIAGKQTEAEQAMADHVQASLVSKATEVLADHAPVDGASDGHSRRRRSATKTR